MYVDLNGFKLAKVRRSDTLKMILVGIQLDAI